MNVKKSKIMGMIRIWIVIIFLSLIYTTAKKELVIITIAFLIPAFQHSWFDSNPRLDRAYLAWSIILLDIIVLFINKMNMLERLYIPNGEEYLSTISSGLSILPLFFLALLSPGLPNLPLLILKQAGTVLVMQDLLGVIPLIIRSSFLIAFIVMDKLFPNFTQSS